MKHIYLLGATGSIGTQTLDIIRNHSDRFRLVAFSFGKNIKLASQIIKEFKPEFVSTQCVLLIKKLQRDFPNTTFTSGEAGLIEVATYKPEVAKDALVVNALMGGVGLRPTLMAIESGRDVALANKETLVMAGSMVTAKAREHDVKLLPVDSEHSAIWQCLNGEDPKKINKLIITASGGSFRDLSRDELKDVTKEQALNHPNWSMGSKITIDSATMMNKGLEVIEAHYLFDLPYDDIKTILHPQSIVHSMVEFVDTSMIAHLGTADMKIPIAYAMNYPDRAPIGNTSQLDLAKFGSLDFKEMDLKRYPCLAMAYDAGRKGDTYPMVLNAANEEAVALFLADKIAFLEIEDIVREALHEHEGVKNATLEQILEINDAVREKVRVRYDNRQ
jgi:1-deoxy-D-xylulose-5-phosphate reductoisomerase